MLKGKTIIELTNVKTGEVERREEDNMITNAISHLFEPLGHFKSPNRLFTNNYDFVPYYQNLIGGILFFDGQIQENAERIFPPTDVNLTACGVYAKQNDTTNTCRGSYNMTESEISIANRYAKFVYDFNTSQGNGNISCVALTSRKGGYCSYGAKDATLANDSAVSYIPNDCVISFMSQSACAKRGDGATLGVTQFLFAIDPENDTVWYFRINSTKSISIVKRKGYFKSVGLFNTPTSSGDIIETIDLQEMSTGLYATSPICYNYNDDEKCLYIYTSTSSIISAGAYFRVFKIDLTDNSVTEYSMVNQTGIQIYLNSPLTYVYNGFIYIRGYGSPYRFFKITLGNSTDIREISVPSRVSSYPQYPSFMASGRIFYEPYNHAPIYDAERLCVLNTDTDEYSFTESRYIYGNLLANYAPAGVPIIGHPECIYAQGYFVYPALYLATINNIDPVTKTADKTMKVTYIIREHQD